MTVQEFNDDLRLKLNEVIQFNKPLELGARSAHAGMAKRIFTDGLNSSMSPIGNYNSTDEMYVNPSTSPGNTGRLKPPTGKHGATEFASGKKKGQAHKTTWVQSYQAYKELIGRRTEKVNMFLSGDLKSDFENPTIQGPAPIKVSRDEYQSGFKRSRNAGKAAGNEQHFGGIPIFILSEPEKKTFFDTVEFELRKIFAR